MSMQQGNITSINWNMANSFYGYVQDDTIFRFNNEPIGVTMHKYKQVEEALIKCKNRLIELGEIKVPKTQEEIIKEQNAMLEDMISKYQSLQQEVKELKDEQRNVTRNNQLLAKECTSESRDSNLESSGDSRSLNDTNKAGCRKRTSKSKE